MRQSRGSAEKMAIVLEGLKGIKPVTDICREHKIGLALYYCWRNKFLEGGKKALVKGQVDDSI